MFCQILSDCGFNCSIVAWMHREFGVFNLVKLLGFKEDVSEQREIYLTYRVCKFCKYRLDTFVKREELKRKRKLILMLYKLVF